MRIFQITLIILFAITSNAQSVESYLGQAYNSKELTKLRSKLSVNTSIESFLPYQKIYKVEYPDNGLVMEYNTNLTLFRISLYDSGYAYKQYKLELPFSLNWKMSQLEIESQIGALEILSDNPFKKRYTKDNSITDFYFTNGRVSGFKIVASNSLLQTKRQDVFKGWGIRLLPDGTKIEGDVVSGDGTMMWGKNAAVYKGEWSYGLPHGKGEYVDSFGNKYSGNFKLGFFWGNGNFFSKNYGYSYSGEYVMGKKHGQGKINYSNKVAYQGSWFRDEMRGLGKYVMGQDYYYEGIMLNNSFNGKGELHTPDGTITGSFKNGKPNGICEQKTQDNTQSLKGKWVNGIKQGKFTLVSFGVDKVVYYENDIEMVNQK